MGYVVFDNYDLGGHLPYRRDQYADGAAFYAGQLAGGWRDTCVSSTGIYWGPFRANRNRRVWKQPPWRYSWWKMWAWMNEIVK